MILIIFTHPCKESHNGKILDRVTQKLNHLGKNYEVLDLCANEFNPELKTIEYQRMRKRKPSQIEPDVKAMQDKIERADTLVFIYPTWWYNMPAKLKGFMDRVFSNGFAYKFFRVNRFMLFGAWLISWIPGIRYLAQPYSVTGFLKGKKAFIFRTYGGPALGKRMFGNTQKALENVILRFCGITNITIHELFNTDKKTYTQAYEERYLKKAEKLCEKM